MDERLIKILANVFDMKSNEINILLTRDKIYKWDSLVHMDLVANIENEFNIQLETVDIIAMDSVSNIISVLAKYNIN